MILKIIGSLRQRFAKYNNTLAFTSVGIDVDNQAIQRSGPVLFQIHGTLHHLMEALMSPNGLELAYAQLYIYDPEKATNMHVQCNLQLDAGILLDLHTTLRDTHPYAPPYKHAYEIVRVSLESLYALHQIGLLEVI